MFAGGQQLALFVLSIAGAPVSPAGSIAACQHTSVFYHARVRVSDCRTRSAFSVADLAADLAILL